MKRYLVVINYDGPHDRLVAQLRALALAGEARFHVVVPAVPNADNQTDGQARAAETRRLDAIESTLAQVPGVDGEVGDENICTAIRYSLDRAEYDVLVVVTPRVEDRERAQIIDRLVRLFGLPVVPVSADESTWLQHHPIALGLGLDQGATRRGPLTGAATAAGCGSSRSHAASFFPRRSPGSRGGVARQCDATFPVGHRDRIRPHHPAVGIATVSRADLDRRPQPRTVSARARRVPHDARALRDPHTGKLRLHLQPPRPLSARYARGTGRPMTWRGRVLVIANLAAFYAAVLRLCDWGDELHVEDTFVERHEP